MYDRIEIDQASRIRDHDRVCVMAWSTVLISFRLKFVDKDAVLLWSHHAGKFLLLVIDTTSKAYRHARRSHNMKTPTTQLAMFVCAERVYDLL